MEAYYNETDAQKAAWLRELIARGLIAPGDVDERSIVDVRADDLGGYTQCHFFAGIGVWSYAARCAGWPDDRPLWTGSCPCPSFSAAGKGRGFDDPRHLWPEWFRLIRECGPGTVLGEQVAAAIGHGWLDLVCGDLEAEGYAVAPAVLGAHSAGAPHIRQRLYFCAHAECGAAERWGLDVGRAPAAAESGAQERERIRDESWTGLHAGECAHAAEQRHDRRRSGEAQRGAVQPERPCDADGCGDKWCRWLGCQAGGSGDAAQRGLGIDGSAPGHGGHAALADEAGGGDLASGAGLEGHFGDVREWRGPGWLDPLTARSVAEAGATRGFWADCDWWYGRDGKYRPTGPGIFPLAHGAAARVVRLRGYGDGIVAPLAQIWIETVMEVSA